jgi:hypothetical protein
MLSAGKALLFYRESFLLFCLAALLAMLQRDARI